MSKQISTLRRWLLSSPPAEWVLNQLRELLIGAINQGKVPRHIAFVMDGNRRYARSRRIETVEGHNLGFEALARILEVCYKSGVSHVTIYAFSIENFKRSRYEVDALMEMAKIKLTQLSQHGELLDRYGARIRILGQRNLLSKDVLEAMDRAVKMTEKNERTVLNVCFPYTSRDEMTSSVREVVEEWCRPVRSVEAENAHRRRAFAEDRIRRNVERQEQLGRIEEREMERREPMVDGELELELELEDSTSLYENKSQDDRLDDLVHLPDRDRDQEGNEHETFSLLSPSSSTTTLPQEMLSASAASSPPTSYHSSPKSAPQRISKPSKSSPSLPNPESITADTISAHLFAPEDPPLDLLVRTSGVERLSDFMLWQCHEDTRIVFLDVLWPEFDLWNFLPVLWEWQWRMRKDEQRRLEEGAHVVKVDERSGRMH